MQEVLGANGDEADINTLGQLTSSDGPVSTTTSTASTSGEIDTLVPANKTDTLKSTTDRGTDLAKTRKLGAESLPVPLPDQSIALIQFAGPTQLTKTMGPHAFRIVGFFYDDDDAEDAVEGLPKVATCKAPTANDITFGTRAAIEDPYEQVAFINNLRKRTRCEITKVKKDFDEYVLNRQNPDNAVRLNEEEKQDIEEQREKKLAVEKALEEGVRKAKEEYKTKNKRRKVRRLKESHIIPGQRYAVVSIDHHPDDENLIKEQWVLTLWGGFADKKAANAYLSDTIQHHVPDNKTTVVKMYEWIYPDQMKTHAFQRQVRGIYQFQEQQDTWDGAFGAKAEAEMFIKKRKAEFDAANLQAEIEAGLATLPEGTTVTDATERAEVDNRSQLTSAVRAEPTVDEGGGSAKGGPDFETVE